MLPNKYSYTEWINDMRGVGEHPVKYSIKDIYNLLENHGFKIIHIQRVGMVPKNLTGLSTNIKKYYAIFSFLLNPLDKFFQKIPVLAPV